MMMDMRTSFKFAVLLVVTLTVILMMSIEQVYPPSKWFIHFNTTHGLRKMGVWQEIQIHNVHYYLLSAYYFKKETVVKVIAVARKPTNVKYIHAKLIYQGINNSHATRGSVSVLPGSEHEVYQAELIEFPVEKGLPLNISVAGDSNNILLQVHFTEVRVGEVNMCVRAHSSDKTAGYLTEFLELHRLVGVEHFSFYDSGFTEDAWRILSLYQYRGEASIHTQNLPVNLSGWVEHHYVTALDCLYWSRGRYRYTIYANLDDLLIPKTERTFRTLLPKIDDESTIGFILATTHFCEQMQDNATAKTILQHQEYPVNLVSILKTIRRHEDCGFVLSKKIIVKPERVTEYDVKTHTLPASKVMKIPSWMASSHHYWQCPNDNNFKMCPVLPEVVVDTSVHRYLHELTANVITTIHLIL